MAIALGDIDGDGYDDFIGTTGVTASKHYAQVYFGGPLTSIAPDDSAAPAQVAANQSTLTRRVAFLELPAPLQTTTLMPSNGYVSVSTGDLNADGVSDMVFTVGNTRQTVSTRSSDVVTRLQLLERRRLHRQQFCQRDRCLFELTMVFGTRSTILPHLETRRFVPPSKMPLPPHSRMARQHLSI